MYKIQKIFFLGIISLMIVNSFGCSKSNTKRKTVFEQSPPSGIPNIGNTCYLASAMQCIANHKDYRNMFVNPSEDNKDISEKGKILIEKISKNEKIEKEDVQSFKDACTSIKLFKIFEGSSQQDSDEFLMKLCQVFNFNNRIEIREEKYDKKSFLLGKNNKVGCDKIRLNLAALSSRDLGGMVKELYTKKYERIISGSSPIDIITKLVSCKNLLPIQINRGDIYGKKDQCNIAIPYKFGISKECFEGSSLKSLLFELKSVIVHYGSTYNSGHYVAYVKKGSQWYLCNDSTVTQVSDDDVKEDIGKNGYVFFYEKK